MDRLAIAQLDRRGNVANNSQQYDASNDRKHLNYNLSFSQPFHCSTFASLDGLGVQANDGQVSDRRTL